MIRVIGKMVKAIRSAAVYNPDVQVAPACILWPDCDRQWEAIIPRMQIELPELFVLGDYDIEKRIGPAIWLRCVLAGKISIENETPMENEVNEKQACYRIAENIPIFYLSGFSRQDLRAVETCPEQLKPLAELQYRGVIWSQINAKDWTILSFLKSDQGGLGLDVAQDNNAKNAMQLALSHLLDENISLLIRKCAMPLELFANAHTHGGWPQWNERREQDLRRALLGLSDIPAHKARQRIAKLDKSHRERRKLVWVELGESPLALALRPLSILSEITANPLAAGSVKDLATGYSSMGWKADAAVLQAISFVEKEDDFQAVKTAIRSIYMPWVEDSARYFQKQVDQSGYPGAIVSSRKTQFAADGECILFVDGLRYDLAQQLSELLNKRGYKVAGEASWAALPSVTATGKPAVSPVREFIEGGEANSDFVPSVATKVRRDSP